MNRTVGYSFIGMAAIAAIGTVGMANVANATMTVGIDNTNFPAETQGSLNSQGRPFSLAMSAITEPGLHSTGIGNGGYAVMVTTSSVGHTMSSYISEGTYHSSGMGSGVALNSYTSITAPSSISGWSGQGTGSGSYDALITVPGGTQYKLVGGSIPTSVTFTFNTGTPSSLVLGVITDSWCQAGGTNGFVQTSTITATATGGSNATVTTRGESSNNTAYYDVYFFTLNGISAGDTLTLSGTTAEHSGTATGIMFAGATIDPVPEPATLGLMALMGAGILLIGRKRKSA